MSENQFYALVLIEAVVSALFAMALADIGKRAGLGFVLGLVFGPFGVIAAAIVGVGLKRVETFSGYPVGYAPAAAGSAARITTGDRAFVEPAKDIPAKMTVARNGEVLGTWLYADVLDYLADGRLLPTDMFRDSKKDRQWAPLSSITA
jgi:hypothetical protein